MDTFFVLSFRAFLIYLVNRIVLVKMHSFNSFLFSLLRTVRHNIHVFKIIVGDTLLCRIHVLYFMTKLVLCWTKYSSFTTPQIWFYNNLTYWTDLIYTEKLGKCTTGDIIMHRNCIETIGSHLCDVVNLGRVPYNNVMCFD